MTTPAAMTLWLRRFFAGTRPPLELPWAERCRRIRELRDWPEVPQGKLLQETLEAMMKESQ